jgi:uncharacterized protein YukE
MTQSTTSITSGASLSAGNRPNYANEHDPSWEEVIAMVVIPGQPGSIREAAGAWDVLISRVEQVRSALDSLSTSLAGWEGSAGEAYRGHLTELSSRITEVVDAHRPVPQQLNAAADNLDQALSVVPIPDELVEEAMQAREQFLASGNLDTRFHRGYFFDALLPSFMGPAKDILSAGLGLLSALPGIGDITDKASDMVRDFLSDGDDKAKAAYQALVGQHSGTQASLGSFPGVAADDLAAAIATPTMPAAPSIPSAGPGTGSFSGTGAIGAGGAPGVDPSTWTDTIGTGLAGAGGAGPVAVGGGTGGPGMGGLGPVGAGGPGAGGIGTGGAGLGGGGGVGLAPGMRPGGTTTAASAIRAGGVAGMPIGGVAGAGGARGGAARGGGAGGVPMAGGAAGGGRGGGARGAGSGRAGGGPPGVASRVAGGAGGAGAGAAGRGMVGGMAPGAGSGAPGEGTDHSTWLNEDEDVWGVDSDAPPPVVG